MVSSSLTPASISAEAFGALLARYPGVIAAVSEAKGARPGQKSLAELDAFRYSEAPSLFGRSGGRAMTKPDVLSLVDWKLRHGKFRPTLMKLVSSNDALLTQTVVEMAVSRYRSTISKNSEDAADVGDSRKLAGHVEAALAAVKEVSALKGVGPATASLLVAVHFPETCIFFSDEAYAWLAGGPRQSAPSKYNLKEYADVARGMIQLLQQLPNEYGAQDVEQVAYVLMHDEKARSTGEENLAGKPTTNPSIKGTTKTTTPAKPTAAKSFPESRKRKDPPTDAVAPLPSLDGPRRSSRHKS
ncbi:hypothetical protein SEPCBS119000_005844 [Sporothrix epigloea]|uniref:Uncharacterized protein n=1 Tax=Sporothrix epigloea TaxID=1892477 RepID=A0ABP0DZS1_9PEZI